MSDAASADRGRASRVRWLSLALGILALIPCIVGAFFSPTQFFRAYLAAWLFCWGIGLGGLAILMIYHLTGGAWGFLLRRILEAQSRTLPLVAVLFAPLAWGIAYLYPWAQPEAVAASDELQYKQFYLNPEFFWIRAAIYFIVWIGLAWVLGAWSREEDRTGSLRPFRRSMNLSGIGAVIYGASIHFAAIDWIMSLQPTFHSSIFGPLTATSQILSAHAFAVIVFCRLSRRPPLSEAVSLKALNDLGNLLLTFMVMWAYMAWFQFMLVWIADLPVDVVHYVPRAATGWKGVAWAIFLLSFVVPFFLLLLRAVKQIPQVLAIVAGLLLFMQLTFQFYQVLPAFLDATLAQNWMDFLMPIGLGGIWLAWFLWELERRPLMPRHDPSGPTAERLRRLDEEEAAREEVLADG